MTSVHWYFSFSFHIEILLRWIYFQPTCTAVLLPKNCLLFLSLETIQTFQPSNATAVHVLQTTLNILCFLFALVCRLWQLPGQSQNTTAFDGWKKVSTSFTFHYITFCNNYKGLHNYTVEPLLVTSLVSDQL